MALGLLFNGCDAPQRVPAPPAAGLASAHEVIERYNANAMRIDRLWTRAVVELKWTDDRGKHYEQGDGNLILIKPDRVALSIGKLGNTIMWAGCDGERYWLFDLNEAKTLYSGLHANAHRRDRATRYPLPVHPLTLLGLMGITPIPADSPAVLAGAEDRGDGDYMVEPRGGGSRLWLDGASARVTRIDLLDAAGQTQATCRLSRWQRVAVRGLPPGALPWVATRLELTMADREGSMTLFLSDPTDGREGDRIKDKAFDLAHLTKVFKPEKTVDLDAIDPLQAD